jgi:hypothetical protein
MVIVMPTQKNQLDFVTLTSIDYCLKRCGGPALVFNENMNFSTCEGLGIVGHGSPGSIEGKPAADLADIIVNSKNGVKPGVLKRIVITSCYAGAPASGGSVIEVFAKALHDKGINGIDISGAIGPSIKADALGEKFKVVQPNKGARKKAGKEQQRLTSIFDYAFLQDLKVTPDDATLEYQAEFAAEVTHAFFKDFVTNLSAMPKVLASDSIAMKTIRS